jgi:uncharacterized coiled-coil DUF342 family protein
MTQKIISKVTLEQKFKQMYSSEIVPLLTQKKVIDAKRNELSAKISELYYAKRKELDAKENELYAKRNELYAKRYELSAKINELYAKINELYAKRYEFDAKIFWKFDKFDKDNNCKVEWVNYDYNFKIENLKVKLNAEIKAEKNKPKVPEEITQDGHTYKLIP